ncbi:hypothetical protein LF817_10580 [Halobacillus sp. A1]|uniref:SCO7613 C-terminal domain-containing membrane protein n=1 Tax=Halobacillus sp. A1 TaxID=2880262 RepID=UPI0020A6528F|nr:hypothetical protein [Halobacillus sp. A1]MCP3031788.1 hypothetical protein [Halobacillus sp. A1]
MSDQSNHEKKDVFHEELRHLRDGFYITENEYRTMVKAHDNYLEAQAAAAEYEAGSDFVEKEDRIFKEDTAAEPKKPEKKPKKKLSKEQLRERNITWSLILGVILLLISGLVVATSQWEQMGSGLKVFSIFFVSLFFLGLSFLSRKYLKIEQTAFAFLTLGSLLIPIAVLAIGYFELWGSYLSFNGEGRYILGLLGALIPLPLYVRNAFQHQSRLFVWIALIFLSLSAGFGFGALQVRVDAFYLLVMLFNAGLLFLYQKVKHNCRFLLFTKELPIYVQANIILSTLLMLVLFESEVFYSFNLFLTAGLYLAMVFVYQTKEYQFVFSALLAYGLYQLVENTGMAAADTIVYACAGLFYVGFAYASRKHHFMRTAFLYTSGVVSFLAFLYISYEGITLHAEDGSVLLFLAYLIMAINYGALAYLVKQLVFQYLAPVFVFAAAWQIWLLGDPLSLHLEMFMFIIGVLILIYPGLSAVHRLLQPVKDSSFYTAAAVIGVSLYFTVLNNRFGEAAVILFVVGLLSFVIARQTRTKEIREAAIWIHPVSWLLSFLMLFLYMNEYVPNLPDFYKESPHFALSGAALLGISEIYRKLKRIEFSRASFYIGQSSFILALILILYGGAGSDIGLVLILFIGIGVLTWLVRYTGISQLWILPALLVLAWYSSLLLIFPLEEFSSSVNFLMFGPVLLMTISQYASKKWTELKPYFFWMAHAALIPLTAVVLLDQTIHKNLLPLLLIIPLMLYVFSTLTQRKEWQVKTFLYAAMATVFALTATVPGFYNWLPGVPAAYAWLVASIMFTAAWVFMPWVWKRRTDWFIIPFSIIGLISLIHHGSLLLYEMVPILFYIVLICLFIERREWSVFNLVPLALSLALWEQYRGILSAGWIMLILVLSFSLLLAIGHRRFKRLIPVNDQSLVMDSYSWTAFIYIPYLTTFLQWESIIWLKIVPPVLLGLWFLINRNRLREQAQVFETLGILCFYAAYLLIVYDYRQQIPNLVYAELQVLPLIGVLAIIRKYTWKHHNRSMNRIQLALLLFIAAYLVVDAIRSHTIWDAWMIGGLSLVSMIIGMQLRIKAYFFVGMGVLIFNVIYQTRPYWGNMPWWVYLLVAGFLLIGVASYNEWQKQQKHNPVGRKMKQLWSILKEWN